MKEIRNRDLRDTYIRKHQITEHLSKQGIAIRLVQYEAEEVIIQLQENVNNVKFLVEGTIQIYGIRKDGYRYPVREIDTFEVLGDVEFLGNEESTFLVEAKNKVLCLVVPFHESKDKLLEDNIFLRYLLHSLSIKMSKTSTTEAKYTTLDEKLIAYMMEECPNRSIESVEKTVFQLKCSRRQLQRVLKKLTDEQVIVKTGKGRYELQKNKGGNNYVSL